MLVVLENLHKFKPTISRVPNIISKANKVLLFLQSFPHNVFHSVQDGRICSLHEVWSK